MNIQKKIDELKSVYNTTKELHPDIEEVFYTVPGIPLETLKAYAAENKLRMEYNDFQKSFRLTPVFGNLFITLKSKKVKPIIPQVTEYIEIEA